VIPRLSLKVLIFCGLGGGSMLLFYEHCSSVRFFDDMVTNEYFLKLINIIGEIMEILIFVGLVIGVLFWIRPFVENADPKKNPIQAGLKKMSEGMLETVDAVGKETTNSVAEYKYERKFEKGNVLSGRYDIQIDMNQKNYKASINYFGGPNSFDIDLFTELGSDVDVWDGLSDSEKNKLNSKIRDYVRALRHSVGLSNEE
jgi:hypothetical protein